MHPSFCLAMTASLVKSVIDHFILDLTLGTSREFTFSRVSAGIPLHSTPQCTQLIHPVNSQCTQTDYTFCCYLPWDMLTALTSHNSFVDGWAWGTSKCSRVPAFVSFLLWLPFLLLLLLASPAFASALPFLVAAGPGVPPSVSCVPSFVSFLLWLPFLLLLLLASPAFASALPFLV